MKCVRRPLAACCHSACSLEMRSLEARLAARSVAIRSLAARLSARSLAARSSALSLLDCLPWRGVGSGRAEYAESVSLEDALPSSLEDEEDDVWGCGGDGGWPPLPRGAGLSGSVPSYMWLSRVGPPIAELAEEGSLVRRFPGPWSWSGLREAGGSDSMRTRRERSGIRTVLGTNRRLSLDPMESPWSLRLTRGAGSGARFRPRSSGSAVTAASSAAATTADGRRGWSSSSSKS